MVSNLLTPSHNYSEDCYETNHFGIDVEPISENLPPMDWSDSQTEVYLTASEADEDKVCVIVAIDSNPYSSQDPSDILELCYGSSLTPEDALQVAEKAIDTIIASSEDPISYPINTIIENLMAIGFED